MVTTRTACNERVHSVSNVSAERAATAPSNDQQPSTERVPSASLEPRTATETIYFRNSTHSEWLRCLVESLCLTLIKVS